MFVKPDLYSVEGVEEAVKAFKKHSRPEIRRLLLDAIAALYDPLKPPPYLFGEVVMARWELQALLCTPNGALCKFCGRALFLGSGDYCQDIEVPFLTTRTEKECWFLQFDAAVRSLIDYEAVDLFFLRRAFVERVKELPVWTKHARWVLVCIEKDHWNRFMDVAPLGESQALLDILFEEEPYMFITHATEFFEHQFAPLPLGRRLYEIHEFQHQFVQEALVLQRSFEPEPEE